VNKVSTELVGGAGSGRDSSSPGGRAARSAALREIEDQILTEARVRFYGTGVVIAHALSLAWRLLHGQWIYLSDGKLRFTDFGWMWLSGQLAVEGYAGRIFDHASFPDAQVALFGRDDTAFFYPFTYPPTFLFFSYPLGWMPYLAAFIVWILATLLFYEAAVYAIISRRTALIAAIAPFPVAVNIDFAHNGFLTAALIGFSLVHLERRPWLSGVFLGLLTYKPHIGALFPLALLASRNWRALGSAAAASVIFGIAAASAFGSEGWSSFFHTLLDRQSNLIVDPAAPLALHSVFGFIRWTEASPAVAWAGHLVVAAIVAISVGIIWAKPIPYSLKAAILCIGSAMMSPHILFYDLCILSIAVAFLVRDGAIRGFLQGERILILICFVALFLVQVPIGPVICAALLFLTVRRIFACRRLGQAAALQGAKNFEMKVLIGD
jgi:hypothetical protein